MTGHAPILLMILTSLSLPACKNDPPPAPAETTKTSSMSGQDGSGGQDPSGGQDASSDANSTASPAGSASAPEPGASAAASSSAAAAAVALQKSRCAALECKSEGSFEKMCDCRDNEQEPPFTLRYTGKWDRFFKRPDFELSNTTSEPIFWASVALYYYDPFGKQLMFKFGGKTQTLSRVKGDDFLLKPKESRIVSLGYRKKHGPKNIDAIQVVIDGWCFGKERDPASHFCVRLSRASNKREKVN